MRRMLDKSELVSQEQYEDLVRVIPTDVHVVEDEGAWQIQLEHDSNILSITDLTPFVESIGQQKPT